MFGLGFSKEKSRANAEKYLQQNKLQNAIAEYEKILQVEPRDFAILNQVGDIYSRLGQNEKAVERFRVVGEAYAADGFTLKSIAMYKKITKLDPNGLSALEKLAELYRKQGLVSDARSMLLQAADAYGRKGQNKETLRLLKQLVLFDPENVQVITRTADLMTQGGQVTEAREMLSQTASTLVERHSLEPARKILERLIALDKSNLRAQELRAQVTFELGDAEKAVELYEAIPDLDSRADGLRNLLAAYLKLEKLDEARPIARKLISVHHDADGIAQLASRLYKESKTIEALELYNEFCADLIVHDREDMLAHLHGAVGRVRNNPDALQMLYSLFRRCSEDSMIAEILELTAHACVQANQFERARDAYKELIEREPENTAHIQGYRQVCAHLDPAVPAPPVAAKREDSPRTLEEFLTSSEPDLPKQNYSPEIAECIAAAISEAELCESYSSKARGITALESALHSAPDDLQLNRLLGQLYTHEGMAAKAARCYNTMQRVLENLGQTEAADYYANLVGSEQTTTWEASGSEFTARDFDLAAGTGEVNGSAEEIDLSGEWESVWQQDQPAVPPVAMSTPAHCADTVPAQPPITDNVSELLDEARFCLTQRIWNEAETAIARLAQNCPQHPELPALRAELLRNHPASGSASAQPESRYAPLEVIEVSDDTAGSGSAYVTPPAPAPDLNSLAAELDAEIGDIFAPATALPARVAAPIHPSWTPPEPMVPPAEEPVRAFDLHASDVDAPQTEFRKFELQATETAAPRSFEFQTPQFEAPQESPETFEPSVPRPSPVKTEFKSAAPQQLETEPESLPAPSIFGDLLEVFEQDLATAQQDEEDPETHFNLGIAFREMGLLDEAIGELQKVCRFAGRGLSPARAQQAYIWLATCFVEKSVPEASFSWFLKALETAPDEETRTAVSYELASAYEAAGYKREALQYFMQVYGSNIDYRDVADRIRELRAAG